MPQGHWCFTAATLVDSLPEAMRWWALLPHTGSPEMHGFATMRRGGGICGVSWGHVSTPAVSVIRFAGSLLTADGGWSCVHVSGRNQPCSTTFAFRQFRAGRPESRGHWEGASCCYHILWGWGSASHWGFRHWLCCFFTSIFYVFSTFSDLWDPIF